ncbi:alpha-ketoacid dehydrogenase subunit beta [Moorella sp. Hama-1]|uniref:alpha-ketoacid dehydrogenase subunit beta n=1 Tax=Moorella sp. Hama-1 TaxID=2138101 RepID=UPI000D64E34A|nr:transketolase C-terminal domain-containing protein [Moorella sp. Hama-1]BCV20676.1 acetoin catabolism protein AcoB [Moorella sp. Hama-1]
MRRISYAKAINEACHQLMEHDPRVIILGQGVNNPWYVGTTAIGLYNRFGPSRVIDPPISENGMNGVAIGAALAGLKPIVIHPRLDFLLMGLEQLVNEAANWAYVFGGQIGVQLVVRGIINRGGEQGAQHSQALQAFFMHVPGLKVVMPSNPRDAKGLLVSAINDGNPVIYIEDRWLYHETGEVPEELYEVPIGKGVILRRGRDVTIVATSYMVKVCLDAAAKLHEVGIDVEVIDIRSLKPLDDDLICSSITKTGKLIIADAAWKTGGVAAEIAARVVEKAFAALKAPIMRVTLPDAPAPSNKLQEKVYYPTADTVVKAVNQLLSASE